MFFALTLARLDFGKTKFLACLDFERTAKALLQVFLDARKEKKKLYNKKITERRLEWTTCDDFGRRRIGSQPTRPVWMFVLEALELNWLQYQIRRALALGYNIKYGYLDGMELPLRI